MGQGPEAMLLVAMAEQRGTLTLRTGLLFSGTPLLPLKFVPVPRKSAGQAGSPLPTRGSGAGGCWAVPARPRPRPPSDPCPLKPGWSPHGWWLVCPDSSWAWQVDPSAGGQGRAVLGACWAEPGQAASLSWGARRAHGDGAAQAVAPGGVHGVPRCPVKRPGEGRDAGCVCVKEDSLLPGRW